MQVYFYLIFKKEISKIIALGFLRFVSILLFDCFFSVKRVIEMFRVCMLFINIVTFKKLLL